MCFFYPGPHLGSGTAFRLHVSLAFTGLWRFLRLPLFWMTLTVFEESGVLLRVPQYMFVQCLSHVISLECQMVRRKTTEVKCPSQRIMSGAQVINVTYHGVKLGHLVQVMFARFLHSKLLPPHFYTVLFGSKSRSTVLSQGVVSSIPPPCGEACTQVVWNSSVWETCVFYPTYQFIKLSTCIISNAWVIILYSPVLY